MNALLFSKGEMMKVRKKLLIVVYGVFLFFSFSQLTCASVILNGTRFIYHGDKKETTVTVTNNNNTPVIIQSWLDEGNEKSEPSRTKVPFVLTPPINRVDQNKGQTLRIRYIGSSFLPTDKESVFWLNVLEIPPKSKTETPNDSKLNVAFRTRVKLFYRPTGLPGNQTQASMDLQWSLHEGGVKITNPSPYFISISSIAYQVDGRKTEERAHMIAPRSSDFFNFKKLKINSLNNLSYTVINDYGGSKTYKVKK